MKGQKAGNNREMLGWSAEEKSSKESEGNVET